MVTEVPKYLSTSQVLFVTKLVDSGKSDHVDV